MENTYSPKPDSNFPKVSLNQNTVKTPQEAQPQISQLNDRSVGTPEVLTMNKDIDLLIGALPSTPISEVEYLIRDLPPDFTERFANKIILFNDGQITRWDANVKIANFVKKHINTPQMYQELYKCMYVLQDMETDTNIVFIIWNSLLWDSEFDKNYLDQMFNWLISANKKDLKFLDFYFGDQHTNASRRYLSDVVVSFCDTCLFIMEDHADKALNHLKKMFSMIFWLEVNSYSFIERQKEDPNFFEQKLININQGENKNFAMFNEIIKYMSMTANGYYNKRHSVSTQHNARMIYEVFVSLKQLLFQDLLSLMGEKVKIDEMEMLKNRNANETEFNRSYELFKQNLQYFRDELRFNPHYIMTEYMRVFLFLFSIALGFLGGLLAMIGVMEMTPTQGLFIVGLMISYAWTIHNRGFYRSILPEDKYYQMQQSLPYLCSSMERFSLLQLQKFLEDQISDADNRYIFVYIPMFLHFLTITYREKLFMFINKDELRKTVFQTNEKVTKMRWGNLSR